MRVSSLALFAVLLLSTATPSVAQPFGTRDFSGVWQAPRPPMADSESIYAISTDGTSVHGYSFSTTTAGQRTIGSQGIDRREEFVGRLIGDQMTLKYEFVSWKARVHPDHSIELYEYDAGPVVKHTAELLTYLRPLRPGDFPSDTRTTSSWHSFLKDFKTAVASRNLNDLTKLTADDFIAPGFVRTSSPLAVDIRTYTSKHDFFAEASQILSRGNLTPFPFFDGRLDMRVGTSPCRAQPCTNILDFAQDFNHNWHLVAVLIPGD